MVCTMLQQKHTLSNVFPNFARELYISFWRSSMSFLAESTFCDNPLKVVSFVDPFCMLSLVSCRDRMRESNESVMHGDLPFDELEFEASFSNLVSSFKDASMMPHDVDVKCTGCVQEMMGCCREL